MPVPNKSRASKLKTTVQFKPCYSEKDCFNYDKHPWASCSTQNVHHFHKKMVNLYALYEISCTGGYAKQNICPYFGK